LFITTKARIANQHTSKEASSIGHAAEVFKVGRASVVRARVVQEVWVSKIKLRASIRIGELSLQLDNATPGTSEVQAFGIR